MKRCLAILLVAAQIALVSCAAKTSNASGSGPAQPNLSSALVAAPCPPPDAVNPLQGIEGWAPGAGHAAEMGQTAAQSFGGFGGALGGEAQTPTPSPTAAAQNCQQLSPNAAKFFADASTDRANIPATGYDVAARAATFSDVQTAFTYVRDAIRTDAYPGVMRGPQGTLMTRAGSSADKAWLLAALLAKQNVTVRYAHTTLNDSDAQQIVAAATAPQATATMQPSEQYGDRLLGAGINDVQPQLTKLQNALAQQGVKITGDASLQNRLMANVRDHWWLQIQQHGNWVDADPSLTNAALGSHVGSAAQSDTPDQLPDELGATVTVRLLADTGDANNLQVVAQATTPAAKAVGVPITISMNADATDPAAVAKQTAFPSNITIGDQSTDGQTLTPDDPSGRLRVLYLETQTAMTGAQPVVQRHVIVDRRGSDGTVDAAWTADRTAYALTFAYRGMEMVGDLDAGFALRHMLDALGRYGLLLDYVAQHPGKFGLPEGATSDYAIDAQRFYQYDASVRAGLQARNPSLVFLFDHPQIVFYRQSMAKDAGKVAVVAAFDVVDNGMTATANDPAAAASANVLRGLIDTNVEQYLLTGPGQRFDTRSLFQAADGEHIGSIVITPQSLAQAPRIAQDGLSGTLSSSSVAYAPSGVVLLHGRPSYGWYAVDAVSGNTIGRMGSGAGQALSEYPVKLYENWPYVKVIGNCNICAYDAMGEALGGSQEHGEHFLQCVGAALCDFLVDLAIGKVVKTGLGKAPNPLTGENFDKEEAEFIEKTMARMFQGSEWAGTGAPAGSICEDLGAHNPYSSEGHGGGGE